MIFAFCAVRAKGDVPVSRATGLGVGPNERHDVPPIGAREIAGNRL
jgi:hypothetical protein